MFTCVNIEIVHRANQQILVNVDLFSLFSILNLAFSNQIHLMNLIKITTTNYKV